MAEVGKNINRLKTSMFISFLFVAVLWIIKLVETGFMADFGRFGVLPQTIEGIKGIFFAPLIHGDFKHLMFNSAPLLILGTIAFNSYPKIAWKVYGISYFLIGVLVWMTARGNSYHIGASGIVYALAFFLLGSGIFRKDRESIALSLIVVLLYGSVIWGILPGQEGVSWESHLYGAVIGLVSAYHFRKVDAKEELKIEDLEIETEDDRHFFEILEEERIKRREQLGMDDNRFGSSDDGI